MMVLVQFSRRVEEEKAWIGEHLTRAYSSRPLLDVAMQLANISSLSKLINSHRPLLTHVSEVGRRLLQRRHSVLPYQRSNIETELAQVDAMWRELETVVQQQKQRLEAGNAADSIYQVICSTLRLPGPWFPQIL